MRYDDNFTVPPDQQHTSTALLPMHAAPPIHPTCRMHEHRPFHTLAHPTTRHLPPDICAGPLPLPLALGPTALFTPVSPHVSMSSIIPSRCLGSLLLHGQRKLTLNRAAPLRTLARALLDGRTDGRTEVQTSTTRQTEISLNYRQSDSTHKRRYTCTHPPNSDGEDQFLWGWKGEPSRGPRAQ